MNGTYQTINLQNIGLIIPGMNSRVGPFRTFDARPTVMQNVLDLSLLSRIRAARTTESRMTLLEIVAPAILSTGLAPSFGATRASGRGWSQRRA